MGIPVHLCSRGVRDIASASKYFSEYSRTSGARCEDILALYMSSLRKYSETNGQVGRFSSIHASAKATHHEHVLYLRGKIERQATALNRNGC